MSRFVVMVSSLLIAVAAVVGWAQQGQQPAAEAEAQQPRSSSSELDDEEKQELEKRTGTTYTTWEEMVADWMTPRPVPKKDIIRIGEKYAFPHPGVSIKMEIVKEEGDTVWLRGIPPENPDSALHRMWQRRELQEITLLLERERIAERGQVDYYLDYAAEIVPPPFMDSLRFEEVASGLPTRGLWQMSFAIDDMNADGILDLVTPPARKGIARPSIFLGKGEGQYVKWREAQWSSRVPYDYGGVATGDFDGDGHRDVAMAIHFKGQYVLYGDGAGGFERSQLLPSPDPRMSSRAVTAADFNGDGRDDLAFLAEIDYDLSTNARIEGSYTLWVVINSPRGWRLMTEGLPRYVIGDNLHSADADGDGRPDLIISSNASSWRFLLYLNRGRDGWEVPKATGVLSEAFHFEVDLAGEGDSAALYAAFTQFRMVAGENQARTGLIVYTNGDDGLAAPGGPIFFDDERHDPVFRLGLGDLNGDGLTDVVIGRKKGGLQSFMQTAAGEFYRELSPEFDGAGRAYDIELLDLDGDGRDDLIVSFAEVDERHGGIRVWLTRDRT